MELTGKEGTHGWIRMDMGNCNVGRDYFSRRRGYAHNPERVARIDELYSQAIGWRDFVESLKDEGLSSSFIASELNRRGLISHTKRPWCHMSVRHFNKSMDKIEESLKVAA